MSVRAPAGVFISGNVSFTQPLADGWSYMEKNTTCRPWRSMIFNLALSDFAGCPGSLADLAFADASGEPIPHASDLGALIGLLTTLPGDVVVGRGKSAAAMTATFKEVEGAPSMLKVQLLLEPLRSPVEPFFILGLRLHVLLFDHHGSFPTLTSLLWNRVITANEARRRKELAKSRPPPINPDPALASRLVTSMPTMGKIWYNVLGDGITGMRCTVKEFVSKSRSSVTNVGFNEGVVICRTELFLHRLSPEALLQLSPETLLMRTPLEVSAQQLEKRNYVDKQASSYTLPDPSDVLVFAGTTNAMRSPFPPKLANELMRAMEEFGGAGQSFQGTSYLAVGVPVKATGKRKSRDLDAESSSEEESESESEN